MSQSIRKRKAVKWALFTIVTPLVVMMVVSYAYIAAWYARVAMTGIVPTGSPPGWLIVRSLFVGVVIGEWFVVLTWWWIWRKANSCSSLFQTQSSQPVTDLAVGAALGAFWVCIYGMGGLPPFGEMFVLNSAKLISAPASVTAGFCEEILFRGFLMVIIERAGGGWKSQILWSSVAFGALHALWGPAGMFWTGVLGASLAGVSLMRGNIWAAVTAHVTLDLCIEPGLMNKFMSLVHH